MLEGRKDGVCLEQPTVVNKGLELKMISCFDSGDRSCTLKYTHTHTNTQKPYSGSDRTLSDTDTPE